MDFKKINKYFKLKEKNMDLVISLIGRPNVGKSTLFNILTKKKDAIVTNISGTTRDRKYGFLKRNNKKIIFIDTAGIKKKKKTIEEKAIKNTKKSISEANLIFFIVNAEEGLKEEDYQISKILRKYKKKTYLIVNKIDKKKNKEDISEFYNIGYKKIFFISKFNPKKIIDFLKNYFKNNIKKKKKNEINKKNINITIIGKPNVGKSTLGNAILKKKQFITDRKPGTTRDSISIIIKKKKKEFILTDTAGIFKKNKKKIKKIELLSIQQSIKMIKKSQIIIFIIDNIKHNVSKQDLKLIKLITKSSGFLLIVINKIDKFSKKQKKEIEKEIKNRLKFIKLYKIHFLSALYKIGIKKLFVSINNIYNLKKKKFTTKFLTRILKNAVNKNLPPIHKKIRIKPKFAHIGDIDPYKIIIHGNQISHLPKNYVCYLTNFFKKKMKLNNSNLRIIFKENRNPYKKRKN